MHYEINGTTFPTLDIFLRTGEQILTEASSMAWMKGDIEMATSATDGFLRGFGRSLTGESFFLTRFTCRQGVGMISFGLALPGTILPLQIPAKQTIICQKEALISAEATISLDVHLKRKLGSSRNSQELVLHKLIGPGLAWLAFAGDMRPFDLQAGEKMQIDPGHLVAYEPTMNFDVTHHSGIRTLLFGGDGLNLITLTGPGRVWLQSHALLNLAGLLSRANSSG